MEGEGTVGGCHGEHISWLPWQGGDIAVAVEVAVAEPEAFLAFLTTGFDGEGEGDNSPPDEHSRPAGPSNPWGAPGAPDGIRGAPPPSTFVSDMSVSVMPPLRLTRNRSSKTDFNFQVVNWISA